MKSNIGIPSALRLAFAVSSLLAALLQALAVLTSYDPSANYFLRGAFLPSLAVVFAILGAICGTVAAYMTKAEALRPSPFSQRLSIPFAALGFDLAAIFLLLNTPAERMTLTLVTSIFLLLATFYHIFMAIPSIRNKCPVVLCFLGYTAIVGCILATAYFYFDISVEMNAPLKVAVQTGLITVMVGYTGELRYLLGKPMPRMYLALISWGISFGSLASLSVPIAYFTGKLPRIDYAAGAVLVLCLVLTQLLRLKTLLTKPADSEQNTSDAPEEVTDGKDLT